MAADVPIKIRRGNNIPAVVWAFENRSGQAVDLTGSVFRLTIQSGRVVSHIATDDPDPSTLILDAGTGRVTWNYTIADGDRIARGARYELNRVIAGTTQTWAGGSVAVESYLP